MFRTLGTALLFAVSASFACSGTMQFLRGEEIEPGVFRVLRGYGVHYAPGAVAADTIGISRMSDFKTHILNLIAGNEIVFIGSIDSIIAKGYGYQDTVVPGFTPDLVLPAAWPQAAGFYGRVKVDTILKGSLPSKHFWFRGHQLGSSCDVGPLSLKIGKFLNYSDKLDSMSDLKISMWESFCSNCPRAHTFDGRYLRSPDFPVLSLDITTLYPDYPATGILRQPRNVVPWRPNGKVYRPDGRVVPEGVRQKNVPQAVLK